MESNNPTLLPLPEDWSRALAIVAHPDDLEYGAASAIARWTAAGKQVTYLLVTRGEAGIDSMTPAEAGSVREKEERRSAAIVGVDVVEFLDHRDGVIEYGLPLRRDLARTIRRHRPELILSLNYRLTWRPGILNMADHRDVGLAVLDASRDAANRWIFPELAAEGLEPWPGVKLVCFNGSSDPTHGVDVTDYIEKGIVSLREHAAYLKGLGGEFDPDAFLRTAAEGGGARLGCRYAVTFEVFRF